VDLAYYQAAFGDWRVLREGENNVEAVTPEDIRRVASATFRDKGTIVATLVEPSFEPDPEKEAAGRAAVASMVDALGQATADVSSARTVSEVALSTPMGSVTGTASTVYALPDRVRSEFEISAFGMKQVQATDGATPWMQAQGSTRMLEGEDARRLHDDVARDLFLLAYPVVADDYVLQGLGEQEGLTVVEVRAPTGSMFTVYLDPDTGLYRKVEYQGTHPMTGDPATIVETYSDFRDAGGLQRPYRVVTTVDGEKLAEATVTEITINGSVEADEFAPPASPAG
jgi:hypothetical protein